MIVGVNPCLASEAVERMRSMVGVDYPYRLGSGDYAPRVATGGIIDAPWSPDPHGVMGSDCAGAAICFAYKLKRHRPGFNAGAWATVSDDINTNSAIEDAEHDRALFYFVPDGDPILSGDLLMYPTIYLAGHPKPWIGHVMMAIDGQGTLAGGPYAMCIVAQCCGPEDRRPAIVLSNATHMDDHDRDWPKPEHRTRVVRVRSDIAIVG